MGLKLGPATLVLVDVPASSFNRISVLVLTEHIKSECSQTIDSSSVFLRILEGQTIFVWLPVMLYRTDISEQKSSFQILA